MIFFTSDVSLPGRMTGRILNKVSRDMFPPVFTTYSISWARGRLPPTPLQYPHPLSYWNTSNLIS